MKRILALIVLACVVATSVVVAAASVTQPIATRGKAQRVGEPGTGRAASAASSQVGNPSAGPNADALDRNNPGAEAASSGSNASSQPDMDLRLMDYFLGTGDQ